MPPDLIASQHLAATAALLRRGLEEIRTQVGAQAYAATLAALRNGAHLQAVTSLSLTGAMHIVMNLVSTSGEIVNLGEVQIDTGTAPPPPH